MNITEFLEARVDEDEAAAKVCLEPANLVPYSDARIPAIKPEEWGSLVDNYLGGPMGKHCARHDPSRVLAECAAKRAIIGQWEDPDEIGPLTGDVDAGHVMGVNAAVLALAAVYADHPDYDPAWKA